MSHNLFASARLLLGVGAMENDYMDVNGDLEHAGLGKKRAQRDDIVLRRRRKRVMVQ